MVHTNLGFNAVYIPLQHNLISKKSEISKKSSLLSNLISVFIHPLNEWTQLAKLTKTLSVICLGLFHLSCTVSLLVLPYNT